MMGDMEGHNILGGPNWVQRLGQRFGFVHACVFVPVAHPGNDIGIGSISIPRSESSALLHRQFYCSWLWLGGVNQEYKPGQ